MVKVRDERVQEPAASEALGLEKACQGHPSKAPALLLLHFTWSGPPLIMRLGLGLG